MNYCLLNDFILSDTFFINCLLFLLKIGTMSRSIFLLLFLFGIVFCQRKPTTCIIGGACYRGMSHVIYFIPPPSFWCNFVSYRTFILLTSSKNQIYEFRIPNISCCLNENLTTFLYTLSLTEATRKQSVYISRMLLKK